jgi:putative oxidoreductase
MLVAAWTVHKENGFFIVKSGWEYNLVLAMAPVCIAGVGPGRFSLDHALGIDEINSIAGWTGLAIAAGLGLLGGIAQLAIFYRPPAKTDAA